MMPPLLPQIHGNLCIEAVAVTDSLDWKLHGFDLLSEQSLEVSASPFCLHQSGCFVLPAPPLQQQTRTP